ncbi:MAG: N-acetylglucosaminyldiphosphoundecaprenol N-acetyl-beta-D-mannosaminyltransferase [Crocinitomix sp.]|jgi:N-acetylglucosaminyldiphosphoundecaprenol N-acetyl-beta-D-mannosaminyltransferase
MKVIGTDLYEHGMDAAIEEIVALSTAPAENLLISPSDANVLVYARRNKAFKAVLEQYFWNLPDGVPSVWILKLKGAKQATRCSGPDLFEQVIRATTHLPINHYLCGGAEGTAKELAQTCLEWGNKNIVGYYSPPFKELSEKEYKEMAERINAVQTSILWVGLGAPKQIYFSHQISKYTQVQFIIPIGAAFDFHTGKVKKAPRWIQKCGMEWFYRLCQEPRRLAKRYFTVVPLFLWYCLLGAFRKSK